MAQLNDVVARVTGASRGAGRGIALELGAAGPTVYVTGRSVVGGPTTDRVPGTIDEAARQVTNRGGRGIAVRCDHTVDADAGFMRTERVVEAFQRAGAADALNGPGGPKETTAYLGRAVVALATDENVIEKSGQLVEVGTLAREYGFTDVNGTQPPPFRIPASA